MVLENIDWELISSEISAHSYFEDSRQILNGQFSFCLKAEISHKLSQMDLFIDSVDKYNAIQTNYSNTLPFDSSSFKYLQLLKKERILDIKEIICLRNIIKIGESYQKDFIKLCLLDEDNFTQKEIYKNKNSFKAQSNKFFNDDKSINYNADPKLKALYHSLLETESLLKRQIDNILSNSKFKDALQFEGYDLVNDKFIVPIRSDRYKKEMGRIINHSNTGQTLYVEPEEIRALTIKREEYLQKVIGNHF